MEIVLVIVLIAIFAAVLKFANKDDDRLHLATLQVLEHIRYTQHLAMSDNKFDPKENRYINTPGKANAGIGKYHLGRWQIRFQVVGSTNAANGFVGYSVFSDFDRQGNIDIKNVLNPAINPADGKWLRLYDNCENCSNDVFLNRKYGIDDISFSANCQKAGFSKVANDNIGAIIFDEKGRPFYGISDDAKKPYEYKLNTECNITLKVDTGKTATISVYPESGYAEILNIEQ